MECGGFFKARWRWCGIGTLTNSFVCYLMMKKGEEKKNLNTHTHTQSIGSLSTKGKKKKRKKKTARGRFVKRLEPTHGPHFFFLLLFFSSSIPPLLSFRGQQSVQLQYRAIRFRFQSWLRLRSRLLDTFRLLLSRRKKDCTARVRQCVFLTPLPPCVCCVLCVLTVFPRNRPTRVSTLIPSFSCFVGFKRDHLSR